MRRATRSLGALLILTSLTIAHPATADEPDALMPVCDANGISCGSVVDNADGLRLAEIYGLDIGSVLDEADVDRLLQAHADAEAAAKRADTIWDRLAQCESGGNWASTVGFYEGGLQFHPQTWDRNKPSGYPDAAYQASREQQIVVGERVRDRQGWGAWPHCARKLGLIE